jgi:cytochrome P450
MGDPAPRMFDMKLRMRADGPGGVPLANNLTFMMTSAHYATTRMAPFHDQPVVPVTKNNGSLVVILGESAVRQVFNDNEVFHRAGEGVFNLPPQQPFSKMFEAVITANGDEHRRRRKLLMPVVQKAAMDHYREIFVETFHRSRFAGHDGPFDMWHEFMNVSKANMLRGMLGLPDTEVNRELADLILTLTDAVIRPDIILFKYNAGWTPYGRWVRRVQSAYEQLAALIEERRKGPQRLDALSIVCNTTDENGDFLTTTEIAGELHGFFSAGFETTALTMTWALLTLIGVPVKSATRGPLDLDLTDEKVLDAAVKESQRLLPAVPMSLPRRVSRDAEIGGTTVPKGSMLFAASIVEHHRPAYYPDPDAYQPARWLDPDNGPRPHEFFPFGIGARRCLGAAFADLQTRVTLGLLAARLPRLLTTTVDYRMKSGVAAAPRKPVMVEFGPSSARLPVGGTVTAFWGS